MQQLDVLENIKCLLSIASNFLIGYLLSKTIIFLFSYLLSIASNYRTCTQIQMIKFSTCLFCMYLRQCLLVSTCTICTCPNVFWSVLTLVPLPAGHYLHLYSMLLTQYLLVSTCTCSNACWSVLVLDVLDPMHAGQYLYLTQSLLVSTCT